MGEYKIKDIERLTGIRAHTIRIWEKRYGILKPERSETKIRKYNDDDLRHILNISILNQNGYKISRIADLEVERINELASEKLTENVSETAFENLLKALVEMDEKSFSLSMDALVKEQGLEAVFPEVIIPFLSRIGVMWQSGTIHPGQEHFVSNLIRQKILVEIAKLPFPKKSSPRALMFLPEGEWHEMGILFQHFVLRKHGILSYYLGQCTPVNGIEPTLGQVKPDFLFTAFVHAIEKEKMLEVIDGLKKLCPTCTLYASGIQVERHAEHLPAHVKHINSRESLYEIIQSILSEDLSD